MLLLHSLSYAGRRGSSAADPQSTQWRLYFPHSRTDLDPANNITTVVFHEVEMRATAGGGDQCTGGSASASSVGVGAGGSANNAFDNDTSTSAWWSSSVGTIGGAEWLQYTFATSVTVRELWLLFYSKNNLPTEIDVQYWDGSAWVTWWYIAFESYVWGSLTLTFNKADLIAPTFSVAPSITTNTGFYGEGDLATVASTHNGLSETFQWTRDGSPIGGATSKTYTYQSADVGHSVACNVTATNGYGDTTASASTSTVVTPAFNTHTRVPAGNMQSGSDSRLTAGDMQSGTDLRTARERTA